MLKLPTRVWPKGQKWAEYDELVPAGIPLSTVMSRDYWIHVQKYLTPGDLISCVAEDGSFDADIRLVSRSSTEMKFRIVRQAAIEDAMPIRKEDGDDRYVVKSGGRAGGWRVVEKTTAAVVADGLDRAGADAEKSRLENERKAA